MDMTTPVLDAVFDKLQDLMRRCNVPAIKHGAMKTMIKFAQMCREDVRKRKRAKDELEFRAKKQNQFGYSGGGSKFEDASKRRIISASPSEGREQEDGNKEGNQDENFEAEGCKQEDGDEKGIHDEHSDEREDGSKKGSPDGQSEAQGYNEEDGNKAGSPDGDSMAEGHEQKDGNKNGSPVGHSEADGIEREDGIEIGNQGEHLEEGLKGEDGDKGSRDERFKVETRDEHFKREGYKREDSRDINRYGYLEEGYKFEDGSQRRHRDAYFKGERQEDGKERINQGGHFMKEGYEQEGDNKKGSPERRFDEEGYRQEDRNKEGSPGGQGSPDGHSEAECYERHDGNGTHSEAEEYNREDRNKGGSPGGHFREDGYEQEDGSNKGSPDGHFMNEGPEQVHENKEGSQEGNKEGSPGGHSDAEGHKGKDGNIVNRGRNFKNKGYRHLDNSKKTNRYGYLEEAYKFEDRSQRRTRDAYLKEGREREDENEKTNRGGYSGAKTHEQEDGHEIETGGESLKEDGYEREDESDKGSPDGNLEAEGYEQEDGNKKRSPDGNLEAEGNEQEDGSKKRSPDEHFEAEGCERGEGNRSKTPGGNQSGSQEEVDADSQHIFERVDLAVMELIHLLNDPITIVKEEAKTGLESLAGINDYHTLLDFVQKKAFLKDDSPVQNSKDVGKGMLKGIREDSIMTQELVKGWAHSMKPLLPEGGNITELVKSANSLLTEKKKITEQMPEENTKISLFGDILGSLQMSKQKNGKTPITTLAPALANKYEKFLGLNDTSNNSLSSDRFKSPFACSAISENEETNLDNTRRELESGVTTENDTIRDFGAYESMQSTPAGVSKQGLSGTTLHDRFFSKHRVKPAKRTIRIPKEATDEICLSADKKAELIALLIDVSARSLMLRRAGGNKLIPTDSTLKKISYLLDLLNQDDPKLTRIADDVIALMKKLRRKLQTADATYERCFQPVETVQIVNEQGGPINHFVASEDRCGSSGDHLTGSKDRFVDSKDHFIRSKDHFVRSKDHFVRSKDDLIRSGCRLRGSKHGSVTSGDHIVGTGDRFASPEYLFVDSKARFGGSKGRVTGSGDCFVGPEYRFVDLKNSCTDPKDHVTGPEERFASPEDRFTDAGERFVSPEYRFVDSNDRFASPEDRFLDPNDRLVSPQEDRFVGSGVHVVGSKDNSMGLGDHIVGSRDHLRGSENYLAGQEDRFVGSNYRFAGPGDRFHDVSMKSIKRSLRPRCLIPSPLRRTMVSGIPGERIARTIELPVSQATPDSASARLHRITGMPERLGNCTASTAGTCHFGKMKVSWTSRAPVYDMDLTASNKDRIRSLKLQEVPRQSEQHPFTKCPPYEPPLLPSLFKQRLHVEMRQMNREINRKSLGMRNVVRLPRLTTEFEAKSKASSTSNLCFEDSSRSKSPATANPPPPPNTAENLFEFAKWMKS